MTDTEDIGATGEQLLAWAKPRAALAVFAAVEAKCRMPNYLPVEFGPLVNHRADGKDPDLADA